MRRKNGHGPVDRPVPVQAVRRLIALNSHRSYRFLRRYNMLPELQAVDVLNGIHEAVVMEVSMITQRPLPSTER
jgi:hypothetical protein